MGIEGQIVKWTIGGAFLIVTLLFAGKLVVVFFTFAEMKIHGFFQWLTSPEAIKDIGEWIWKCIKSTGKGIWNLVIG